MYGGSRSKRNNDQMYRTATLAVFIIIILDEKLEHIQ